MSTFSRVVAGALFGLTIPFWAQGVAAQNDSPPRLAPLSDQKLDYATAALDDLSSLQQNYQDKAVAATPAGRGRLHEEFNQAAIKTIREHGLSVKEYAAFLDAAKNDPEVHEKVFQRIRRWRTHKG